VRGRRQIGPSALVLYDVTTLWFDTDTGDGFREPGFSKERRLDPQITVGLLTDATGMPLMIDAFEGNRAETKTMIPLVQRFVAAHGIAGVTVIADAGMMSEANLAEVEDAGPAHRARHRPAGCQGEKAVAGQAAIKRNRFATLTGGTRAVNRDLETRARTLAGWKPYITNILDAEPSWLIGAYHQLWRIEHAFRMSKHDLRARPVYHHKRESIDAHLAVVFAALAISHRIETQTGWTIKKFVRALRRYRTIKINTGSHTVTAEDPLPDEVRQALAAIHQGAH
jgi:transposase